MSEEKDFYSVELAREVAIAEVRSKLISAWRLAQVLELDSAADIYQALNNTPVPNYKTVQKSSIEIED